MKILTWIKNSTWYIKVALVAVVAIGGYFGYTKLFPKTAAVTYQTGTVSKGTLVTSIAATGSITSGNTTNISTKASGTVTKVYVKNGDLVKKGQKILDMTLDSDGIQNRSESWQAYLKAQDDVVNISKAKQDLSIQIWKDKQAILDAQNAVDFMTTNVVNPATKANYTDAEKNEINEAVTQAKLAFDVDAAKYSHSDADITASKISQQAAYLDYQNVSGSIVSPADGIINNLTLTAGSTLTASTSQSTTTGSTYASSQNIGFIRASNNQYQASVSLTEVDAPKVQAGQKVNITMDAYSTKAFTGKVLAVNVAGSSSSGVSSYPATILMDPTDIAIYPNMTVSATIITNIEDDVLLIPSSAITTTTSGGTTVQVMQNGKPVTTEVVVGDSNDTETVIASGLSEGDSIVTGSSTSIKNSNTTSAFSSTRTGGGATAAFRGPGL